MCSIFSIKNNGWLMYQLKNDISTLKGVGEKTAKLFHKLNIYSIEDLLLSVPRGFTCYEEPKEPTEADNEKMTAISAVPIAGSIVSKKTGRYNIALAKVNCGNSVVSVRFFFLSYIRNVLKPGMVYVLRGILKCSKGQFSMLQPQISIRRAG